MSEIPLNPDCIRPSWLQQDGRNTPDAHTKTRSSGLCKNCAERAELHQEDFWPAQGWLDVCYSLVVGRHRPQHAAAVARASDMESTMRICKAEVRHPTSMVR